MGTSPVIPGRQKMLENRERYLLKCHLMIDFAKKMELLNCTVAEGYPS